MATQNDKSTTNQQEERKRNQDQHLDRRIKVLLYIKMDLIHLKFSTTKHLASSISKKLQPPSTKPCGLAQVRSEPTKLTSLSWLVTGCRHTRLKRWHFLLRFLFQWSNRSWARHRTMQFHLSSRLIQIKVVVIRCHPSTTQHPKAKRSQEGNPSQSRQPGRIKLKTLVEYLPQEGTITVQVRNSSGPYLKETQHKDKMWQSASKWQQRCLSHTVNKSCVLPQNSLSRPQRAKN